MKKKVKAKRKSEPKPKSKADRLESLDLQHRREGEVVLYPYEDAHIVFDRNRGLYSPRYLKSTTPHDFDPNMTFKTEASVRKWLRAAAAKKSEGSASHLVGKQVVVRSFQHKKGETIWAAGKVKSVLVKRLENQWGNKLDRGFVIQFYNGKSRWYQERYVFFVAKGVKAGEMAKKLNAADREVVRAEDKVKKLRGQVMSISYNNGLGTVIAYANGESVAGEKK